jgi:energy-coupling factor transport system permease protein
MPKDPLGLAYVNNKRSLLHKMSPVSKIIWATCIVFLSLFTGLSGLYILLVLYLALSAFLLITQAVPLKQFIRPQLLLVPIWIPLIVLSSLTLAYQTALLGFSSTDVGAIRLLSMSIPYSKGGFLYGVAMLLRGTNIALAALAIVWTTHPRDLVYALTNSFHVPYKISWALFLGLIYAPIIAYETQLVSYAHSVRGIKISHWNPFQRGIISKYLFPVLVRGLRRGSTTANAMEGRAFGAYPTRTFRYGVRSSSISKIFAVCAIAFTAAYVIIFWKQMNWDPSSIIKTAGTG